MKFYVPLTLVSIILFAGCSKPAPEEYLGKANVAINEKNFSLAIEEFEKLIKDHPDSPQAEESMFVIAKIRSDETKEFPLAVAGYRRYVETYPEGKQAPLAMFLVGYIYNNELKELDSAKVSYDRFLAKYPDHEMAPSAKFELQNLGKSPEELLPTIQQNTPQTTVQTSDAKPVKEKK